MINNTCSGCGKEVWIRSKGNSYLNKMLKESTTVVCKNCDPISDWKRRKQNESI
jgi:DNA-directed RNA polymerase subunit RPC12/RpoP